jgi:hypothetical protein
MPRRGASRRRVSAPFRAAGLKILARFATRRGWLRIGYCVASGCVAPYSPENKRTADGSGGPEVIGYHF